MERKTAAERDQISYGLAFYASQQMPTNAESANAHALFFEYGRTWRNVDDLLSPTRGYAVNAQIGAAPPGVSTAALGRGIVQFAAWLPVDTKTTFLFKARSRRGGRPRRARCSDRAALPHRRRYDRSRVTRSIASDLASAMRPSVAATTRSAALKSCAGSRDIWGIAAFVDAGNAADRAPDLKPVYGYGVGGRLRTPIGPMRLDVAYGQETHSVRLHLSVGLSF